MAFPLSIQVLKKQSICSEPLVMRWQWFKEDFLVGVPVARWGKGGVIDQALETDCLEGSNGRLRDFKVAADAGQKNVQSEQQVNV